MSTLLQIMQSRRSVRRFQPEVPPRDVLLSLIEAAVTAPSASNKQPWRFLMITRRPLIAQLAAAVREAVEQIAASIDPGFEDAFRAYGDYFTRFEDAPVVLVPLYRGMTLLSHMVGDALDPELQDNITTMEQSSGLISTSLALQNLLLSAHDAGLGASGMTGPLVALEALRELLGVQPSWQIVAFVPLGYPDESPRPTRRKDAERVVKWLE